MTRRLVISAWLGFALAALFFYPLAVALQTDIYYLQWQRRDIAETVAIIVPLAVLCAWAVFVLWPRSDRAATLGLVAIASLPLASFAAGLSRQLPFDDELISVWESGIVRFGTIAAFAACVTIAFVSSPAAFARWFRRLLIVVSPVSLVVVGSLVASTSYAGPPLTVDRVPRAVAGLPVSECNPVVALLFDELSFSYLYDDGNTEIRAEYPNIRGMAASATHYLAVTAPARDTLVAMPAFLAARHLRDVRVAEGRILELTDEDQLIPFNAAEKQGLFATAQSLGFATEMAGYYLPYCDLLGDLVDTCRSLSFYNVATAHERFSPLDPVLTTLVLWPRQLPFGLLKNRPFAALQRELVEETGAFARRPVRGARPVFRFVHFSVPHLPFVFDAGGYHPPLDPLRTSPDDAYVRQLAFVDRLFREVVEQMRRDGSYDQTTIVLLADHGFRFGGRERDPLHIPFIAKMAGQTSRVDVTTAWPAERLLKDVIQQSCM